MAESKHLNQLGVSDGIQFKTEVPGDYHCNCEYCNRDKFKGEIFNLDMGKYYSNKIRKHYYLDKAGDHLDVGHFIGYRWAIQNLCPEGGIVFDPTVGSGTAIVEAINNGRNGIGIELEYPEIAQKSIDHQKSKMLGNLIQGDARDTTKLLLKNGYAKESFDLIINGTPYPSNGALSSDAPQRQRMGDSSDRDRTFNYNHERNMGLIRGSEWQETIRDMYNQSIEFLKPGGLFVIIIKDMIRKKVVYNLHKEIIDLVLEDNFGMDYEGFFLHKHIPTTMFINTYPKRYPGVVIPLYQTGIILKKD